MVKLREHFVEGIFRRPRLWSNQELRKFGMLFEGRIVNVSGAEDYDKSVTSLCEYYFTSRCDAGLKYKSYFPKAEAYCLTNHPEDTYRGHAGGGSLEGYEFLDIDLEKDLPGELHGRFDVVFNHTVLPCVFDVFKAFENLALLSKDIVIVVVPHVQTVSGYTDLYQDYWRFTPFALEQLFVRNGLEVIYRSSSSLWGASILNFYIGSRNPDRWRHRPEFLESTPLHSMNFAERTVVFGFLQLKVESLVRRIAVKLQRILAPKRTN